MSYDYPTYKGDPYQFSEESVKMSPKNE